MINFLTAMITDSTSHDKKLSNLVKTNTNNYEVKYSSQNDSFTYKRIIFYDVYARTDVLSKAKLLTFLFMLKSLTLDYHYSNISVSDIAISFD